MTVGGSLGRSASTRDRCQRPPCAEAGFDSFVAVSPPPTEALRRPDDPSALPLNQTNAFITSQAPWLSEHPSHYSQTTRSDYHYSPNFRTALHFANTSTFPRPPPLTPPTCAPNSALTVNIFPLCIPCLYRNSPISAHLLSNNQSLFCLTLPSDLLCPRLRQSLM